MTNAEHLIENAICSYEDSGSFDYFLSHSVNKKMANECGVDLGIVAEMADYVLHVARPMWEDDM